jgi:hypothetical protein
VTAPKVDPVLQRARVLIQAVEETIVDLKRCPDGGRWVEQIATLEGMRDRLAADLMAAENAA